MKLLIQPDAGITPILMAIKKARRQVDLVIFRCDLIELEKALEAAVARGVHVRARLLIQSGRREAVAKVGACVARIRSHRFEDRDDLVRYHGKC